MRFLITTTRSFFFLLPYELHRCFSSLRLRLCASSRRKDKGLISYFMQVCIWLSGSRAASPGFGFISVTSRHTLASQLSYALRIVVSVIASSPVAVKGDRSSMISKSPSLHASTFMSRWSATVKTSNFLVYRDPSAGTNITMTVAQQ